MSKIQIDIEYIKKGLTDIGYDISECIERKNNGTNWQIKFNNSQAVVNIYDTNKKNNTVVNGKLNVGEEELKNIIELLKRKEIEIEPINSLIIDLINQRTETNFYDYKLEMYKDKADMLHDILCLSNNTENKEAYLIIGVNDSGEPIGIDKEIRSDEIFDFMKTQKFAGGHMPEIDVKHIYYKYMRIGVIICKSSKYVPFYLSEKHKGVFDNQIYTRVGNTNTPKNKHAAYTDVEKLWKIHFQRENE